MGIQAPHPLNYADLEGNNIAIDTKTLLLGLILLFLILISTLSLLYFLYICIRRNGLGSSISPQSQQPLPTGLDKATISCLPTESYNSSCKNMKECSICLGVFQDGEKVRVLPICQHCFHSDCLEPWLLTRSSCPLCRSCVVPVDSVLALDIP